MITIKELAAIYNTTPHLIRQQLIHFNIRERKGKKGNRTRLLPIEVELLMTKIGRPLSLK